MDDLAVPQHHRSGAHRARRHPLLAALATVVAVAVASVVLLWGLLTFDVLGVGDELLDAGVGPVLAEPSAQPSETDPTQGAVATAAPSDGAGEAPDGEPADRSLPLVVLNGTGTAGLASEAAERLESAGWTVEQVGNADGGQDLTTVLYGDASQQATAEVLAGELGASEASLADDVDGLTVVLGSDYSG